MKPLLPIVKQYLLSDLVLATGTIDEYLLSAQQLYDQIENNKEALAALDSKVESFANNADIYNLISKSILTSGRLSEVYQEKRKIFNLFDVSAKHMLVDDFDASVFQQVDTKSPDFVKIIAMQNLGERHHIYNRVFFRHLYFSKTIKKQQKKAIFSTVMKKFAVTDFMLVPDESSTVGYCFFKLGLYTEFLKWAQFTPTAEHHLGMLNSVCIGNTKNEISAFLPTEYENYCKHHQLSHQDALNMLNSGKYHHYVHKCVSQLLVQEEKLLLSENLTSKTLGKLKKL